MSCLKNPLNHLPASNNWSSLAFAGISAYNLDQAGASCGGSRIILDAIPSLRVQKLDFNNESDSEVTQAVIGTAASFLETRHR